MKEALKVLFEDNHLLIVNKPAGVLVQGDETGDIPLSDIVKAYIGRKYNKPGDVFLGVVHRLDRPVSGVVVFARTSKALERMNALFKNRETKKTYWAILTGKPYPIKAMVLFGTDLLLGHGDPLRGKAALEALDFYVHVDTTINPSAITMTPTMATTITIVVVCKLISVTTRCLHLAILDTRACRSLRVTERVDKKIIEPDTYAVWIEC